MVDNTKNKRIWSVVIMTKNFYVTEYSEDLDRTFLYDVGYYESNLVGWVFGNECTTDQKKLAALASEISTSESIGIFRREWLYSSFDDFCKRRNIPKDVIAAIFEADDENSFFDSLLNVDLNHIDKEVFFDEVFSKCSFACLVTDKHLNAVVWLVYAYSKNTEILPTTDLNDCFESALTRAFSNLFLDWYDFTTY